MTQAELDQLFTVVRVVKVLLKPWAQTPKHIPARTRKGQQKDAAKQRKASR